MHCNQSVREQVHTVKVKYCLTISRVSKVPPDNQHNKKSTVQENICRKKHSKIVCVNKSLHLWNNTKNIYNNGHLFTVIIEVTSTAPKELIDINRHLFLAKS